MTTATIPNTHLIELRNQANGLAIAQHVDIMDGYSWQDVYRELVVLNSDDIPVRFTPAGAYKRTDLNTLLKLIEDESDVICEELKKAYVMGSQAATA